MYEMHEPNELQRFYGYVAVNPSVWGSLTDARFELTSGRGMIVEVVSDSNGTSAPSFRARFDRSPGSVSPSVLALPFLLKKGWLKSLSVAQDLIEPFRAFSAQTQEAASTLEDAAVPTQTRKENWRAFKRIVDDQGIKYLYHFTDFRNLKSIREHGGLYSWWSCKQKGIVIPAPGSSEDSRRRDWSKNLQDYVRLSFNRFHPMKHVAREEGRVEDIRILAIDPSVIYLASTLFSDLNANDRKARIGGDIESFERIKFDVATGRWDGEMEKKFFQAEVLVKSYVPLRLMKMIKNL